MPKDDQMQQNQHHVATKKKPDYKSMSTKLAVNIFNKELYGYFSKYSVNYEMLKELIEAGKIPEADLKKALEITSGFDDKVIKGTEDMCIYLLRRGTDLSRESLVNAIKVGKEKVVDFLYEKRRYYLQNYMSVKESDERTLLHEIGPLTTKSIVEKLLKVNTDTLGNPNPNVIDKFWNRTPLHYAASLNNWDAVDTLIKADADVSLLDKMGMTALAIADKKYSCLLKEKESIKKYILKDLHELYGTEIKPEDSDKFDPGLREDLESANAELKKCSNICKLLKQKQNEKETEKDNNKSKGHGFMNLFWKGKQQPSKDSMPHGH